MREERMHRQRIISMDRRYDLTTPPCRLARTHVDNESPRTITILSMWMRRRKGTVNPSIQPTTRPSSASRGGE